jgi:hypothetical protein
MKIGEKNVGGMDRIIRVPVGLALLAVGYLYLAPLLSYLVMLLGLVLLGTAVYQTCLLYSILGSNTNKK